MIGLTFHATPDATVTAMFVTALMSAAEGNAEVALTVVDQVAETCGLHRHDPRHQAVVRAAIQGIRIAENRDVTFRSPTSRGVLRSADTAPTVIT